jgi:hypothetical protein
MISAILIFLFSFLLQDSPLQAPQEIGEISELKALHRVYIYTNDGPAYIRIAKELGKYKDLEVVEKISDAEFVLIYYGNRVTPETYPLTKPDSEKENDKLSSKETEKELGVMKVVVQGSAPNILRVVWQIEKSTRLMFGKDPEIKCTQEFIKKLKEVKEGK